MAGDINDDGIGDLMVSDPDAAEGAGITHVIFGRTDFVAHIDLPDGDVAVPLDAPLTARASTAVRGSGPMGPKILPRQRPFRKTIRLTTLSGRGS